MKMTVLVGVVMVLVGCGGAAGSSLTFDGNFTGAVTETDTCAGFAPRTYATALLWLVNANTKTKMLEINSDDLCDSLQASYDADSASLSAAQCRLLQLGNGDTVAQRVERGDLSLDSNRDLKISITGSYVYSSPEFSPINCGVSISGTLYRFE